MAIRRLLQEISSQLDFCAPYVFVHLCRLATFEITDGRMLSALQALILG